MSVCVCLSAGLDTRGKQGTLFIYSLLLIFKYSTRSSSSPLSSALLTAHCLLYSDNNTHSTLILYSVQTQQQRRQTSTTFVTEKKSKCRRCRRKRRPREDNGHICQFGRKGGKVEKKLLLANKNGLELYWAQIKYAAEDKGESDSDKWLLGSSSSSSGPQWTVAGSQSWRTRRRTRKRKRRIAVHWFEPEHKH